ncbi:transcriptional regulator TyrR [Arsenophonus apicola]|uniref:HTH-type transcriptional regulatory protein TyrR n=1 Tax=Arsenophonus apicola TaxID=2879119 RepID=A0ABY8P6S1_9GAMM|nr:transcriptional regulator TyrR [Arsenophonus apicola]WGO84804.1 transcriptional regulator TyrR [Arsenophonus apicola]
MRLEVICQDRMGLTRELLDLLVLQNIDLEGIEISPNRNIYLRFAQVDTMTFQQLMTEIRRIRGVKDVKTVSFMPSEHEKKLLLTLLNTFPDPIFSVNSKANIELANSAMLKLFAIHNNQLKEKKFNQLINHQRLAKLLEQNNLQPYSERLLIKGNKYLLQVTPINNHKTTDSTDNAGAIILLKALPAEQQYQANEKGKTDSFSQIIAVSPKMSQLIEHLKKIALLDEPLLLVGETGTGKDILAKACHLQSMRGDKPFLGLNCASMPEDVVESELFGYAAGAYPNAIEGKKGFFEQANGGTVLLDEIGEMSPQMQIKLLRFLNDGTFRRVGEEQEVKVDVRVICATQKNLLELVEKGHLRQDLYYRLHVLTVNLPPLRERQADIMPLTEEFVRQFSLEQHIEKPKLSPKLAPYLANYHWPGNVRQLRNVLYQALIQSAGRELTPQNINLPDLKDISLFSADQLNGTLDELTKHFEASILARLYQDYPSTRKLAKRLNVSHTAIANKLREYGLSHKKESETE